ncbi:terminase large subunit [Stappia sp. 22II-S9-Z10]|nr:terminase large subunit [Stappia sp. 22II-S9-Z10]
MASRKTTASSRGPTKPLTRGEKVIAFIEKYCVTPEGAMVGQPMRLLDFQRDFILAIYDNPANTRRAYLSIARKNGKTALIAAIVLAHLVGPEALQNSRIVSAALSRKQAAEVYGYASKMALLSPQLSKITRSTDSAKRIVGLTMNTSYEAMAAEAKTAHGGSPVVAILDEVGQVKGPHDAFFEAITTSQGAHENPLLIAISTQAATDADLFSTWLDDAAESKDPRIVSHVYQAPADCDLFDREAWAAANPALDVFRSLQDVEDYAERASRLPADEQSFRWLFLNQRVTASAPFVSKSVWEACAAAPSPLGRLPVVAGLDLSSTTDLTAFVAIGVERGTWHVHPTFWLPADGLREKSRADRVPYDLWEKQGFLETTRGRSIAYKDVARWLREFFDRHDVRGVAFDRWRWTVLEPYLREVGFTDSELELFVPFGQGYASMDPAMRELEVQLLDGDVRHGGHPVLEMCAKNAVVQMDPAGNRKLTKEKSSGRIDGMVALTMAAPLAATHMNNNRPSVYETRGALCF